LKWVFAYRLAITDVKQMAELMNISFENNLDIRGF